MANSVSDIHIPHKKEEKRKPDIFALYHMVLESLEIVHPFLGCGCSLHDVGPNLSFEGR